MAIKLGHKAYFSSGCRSDRNFQALYMLKLKGAEQKLTIVLES